jgi:hypothetical protein
MVKFAQMGEIKTDLIEGWPNRGMVVLNWNASPTGRLVLVEQRTSLHDARREKLRPLPGEVTDDRPRSAAALAP